MLCENYHLFNNIWYVITHNKSFTPKPLISKNLITGKCKTNQNNNKKSFEQKFWNEQSIGKNY